MSTKNTLENKAAFFRQNLGSYIWDSEDGEFNLSGMSYILSGANTDGRFWVRHERDDLDHEIGNDEFPLDRFSIVKRSLSKITDEHAIELANIAFQFKEGTDGWNISSRDDYSIHLRKNGPVDDWYHFGICFSTGEIYTDHHFKKTKEDKAASYTVNIGKVHFSSSKPLAYIGIIDKLREWTYVVGFRDILVKEAIEFGWVKLDES